ncbi:uncharacterized protein BO72DRAFT_452240 [Aspergillus fijiensis CBS 313.89]|uniref:Uncharacterized protein n=1 Tax=Aspergillus fijiensis CBS 313.89 TaxID=1448319 RepID=A0A8G1RI79_9EURO|nr:uncharacterized protein BO72DRAFT_452240 [Aspergillus fijiensis CBS 313.89]RAK72867.1 hypothetical protein BO72DRAFT_452240 [Aspergillus fijiensis CBS 313.89]
MLDIHIIFCLVMYFLPIVGFRRVLFQENRIEYPYGKIVNFVEEELAPGNPDKFPVYPYNPGFMMVVACYSI